MSKPGNFYLLNYELHSDSSDFESTKGTTNTSQETTKSGRSMETIYPKRKKDLKLSLTGNSSKETYESVTTTISQNGSIGIIEVAKSYKKKKSKIYTECGDQVKTMKSKHSVIRHKVMPCLSNIFRRSSNNVKDNMSIIKENPSENTMVDNGCQTQVVEKKTKKRNARQKNYVIQPVYAVEGNIHAKSSQYHHVKCTRETSPASKTTRNKKANNNYNITSSSEEVETHKFCKRKKVKRNKLKRGACVEKENIERCEEEQFPSKTIQQNPPYHIYTSPCQYQYKNRGCSPITNNALINGMNLSPTCSGFWEYIVNKMSSKSKRGTIKNLEGSTNTPPFKSCTCEDDLAQKPNQSNSSVCHANCCYNHSNPPSCCPSPHNIQNNQISSSCCSSLPRSPPKTKPIVKNTRLSKNKIDCKCPPKQEMNSCPSPVNVKANTPPCQHDHDKITASLSSKYNGEVLCIHNPPCVLINGCLNLPPPKLETTTDLYSVTTDLKNNKLDYPDGYAQFLKSHNRHKSHYYQPEVELGHTKIVDASCQYIYPTKEVSGISYKIPGNHHISPSEGRKQQNAIITKCQPWEIPNDADNRQNQATSIQRSQVWSPYENKKEQMPSYESFQRPPTYVPKQLVTSDESPDELQSEIERRPMKVQKQEKMVQSICNHNPPCEVVRTCCKPKFNTKFQNSCVHVPMCNRVPLCLMDLKDRNEKDRNSTVKCSHSPRCAEVPVCTRNYIVLTAKEEAATQARPRSNLMVCRHEPPCIMIPLCLARVCDSYIPYDAIPDCVHQPMCEMIPACCRKSAKAMVSVRSQCPSQCCIV